MVVVFEVLNRTFLCIVMRLKTRILMEIPFAAPSRSVSFDVVSMLPVLSLQLLLYLFDFFVDLM